MIAQNDWQRVREVFHGALERDPDDRARFLREACEGDDQVRREVASLLAAHDNAEGFLSGPAAAADPESAPFSPLASGSHVGPFEIVELAGRGGMGEVYRARDTRLDRSVAIKFLTPALADNPKGRERFEREARAISKLAHPHICTLLDIGSGIVRGVDARYLVMEFVEGETLAERLRRGPLPAAEAIATGAQIADALAAAHAVGVIHRDLKPGNIMLTRSGAKLLDFGLARFSADGAGTATASSSNDPLTKDGAIVGTLAYMAPEQLRGSDVDARSDVFSFGAVLYEMLSSTRAFDGTSNADIIAAVLERQPPSLAERNPLTPRAVDRLVSTCLAKDPNDRWQSSRDLQRELRWLLEDKHSRIDPPARVDRARRAWTFNWAAATAAALVLAAAVYMVSLSRQAPTQPVITFPVPAPADTTFSRGTAQMSVSPDGSMLAFVALTNDGTRRLWIRRFSALEPWALDDTVNAQLPFWSPDSRSVAFFAADKLVRIDIDGGARRELSSALIPRGGAWNRDGTILFGSNFVLQRVRDTGGVPTPVTSLDQSRTERAHAWPQFLPDGRRFLYLAIATNSSETAIYAGDLDASSTERVLTTNASFALAGNQLLTLIKRALVAQEFDPTRGRVIGQPRELFDRIGVDVRIEQAAFSASGGVLSYRRVGDQSRLTWFDRHGNVLESFREAADYHHASLAPDGRRVAIEKTDPASGRHTIWILDFDRGTSSRLINDARGAHGPVWSPDGQSVLFGSNRFGGLDLYTMPADGSGTESLLLRHDIMHRAVDWSKDGRLVLCEIGPEGQNDLWIVPVSASEQRSPFLDSRADEKQGAFSPDGKWIAYTSNESGAHEVYVRRYPERDAKWRVSTGGGAQPRWRGDGAELFYLAPDGALMAADVKRNGLGLQTGRPQMLFNTGIRGMFVDRRNHYVVTEDGQRFLVNQMDEDDTTAPISVLTNWR